jgi:hypothetical protein
VSRSDGLIRPPPQHGHPACFIGGYSNGGRRGHTVGRLRARVLRKVGRPSSASSAATFLARVASWSPALSRSPYMRVGVAACLLPVPAIAQQQQPAEWAKLPRMQLERQFAGPLQDTVIQRWRDPVDGTICYIYLPITAAHSAPTASGYVQYGPNTIGSMSCLAAAPAAAARGAGRPPATTSRPGAGTATPPPRASPSPAPAPATPDAAPPSR